MPSPRSTAFAAVLAAAGAVCLAGESSSSEESASSSTFRRPDRSLYEEGRYVYEQNCIVCHGPSGDGAGEMATQLTPKPRRFTSGLFKYRSTPWGKLPTDEDLMRTVRDGRTGTAMGMFTQLSEEQLRAVVEYLKFFSRKWRKAENYAPPVTIPPEPEWMRDATAQTQHAEAGRKTFEATCAACHGAAGDGKGPAAGALKDDGGDPAFPADLRQPHLRSGNDLRDIYRVLMTGLNGTPMVSFADALTEEQKWDVVAYIDQLRKNAPAAASGKNP